MNEASNSGPVRKELIGLTREEIISITAGLGEKPYRGRQIYDAIYRRRVGQIGSMTDLPLRLRQELNQTCQISRAIIKNIFISSDGTRRYLIDVGNGARIETVFMPEEDRDTICLSSQSGCPLACDFCMTGVMGFNRNITAGEVLSQILIVLNDRYGEAAETPHGTNIVIMGMGEPLLNYDNVIAAIRLLADPSGIGIASRRVTLSTAGIIPGIRALAQETIRPRLAISLGAASDELRSRLMPINRKYPLSELIAACREFPLTDRERLTFEYVMLEDVNDSERDAIELVRLLKGIRAKVNLIPLNTAPEIPYRPSSIDRVLKFQGIVVKSGMPCFIRKSRGQDISAACGQLAAREAAFV